jgi:hypothetical protein
VNSSSPADRLHDPRDVAFALHALLGIAHPRGAEACREVAARLPDAPTLDELVEVALERRPGGGAGPDERLKARTLLAAYFAIDPPVDPDPAA